MKKTYALIILGALLISGCGGNLRDKLIGTWKIDTASMASPDITPTFKKSQQGIAQMKDDDALRVEFKSDGTYSGTGMSSVGNGTWTLVNHTLTLVPTRTASSVMPRMNMNDAGDRIHVERPMPTGKGVLKMDMVKVK